ncbi:hypothetical protein M2123_002196, partial [Polynucleobacter sphagniphilus]|nr:hypothetical protein [Polynucleobacter sphagniphilus]
MRYCWVIAGVCFVIIALGPNKQEFTMKLINIKNIIPIVGLLFLAIANVGAQSCAGGTTTYSSPTTGSSTFDFSTNNTCVTITPSGSYTVSPGADAVAHNNETSGNVVTNNGSILGGTGGYGVTQQAANTPLVSIINTGTISSVGYSAISNFGGTITGINNSGLIQGAGTVAEPFGIENSSGTITTITNTGSITGGSFGISNTGIGAVITTLNNGQGAGNTNGALTYSGKLPSNYNIIISGPTNFGKLAVTGASGSTTTFGIYTGSTVLNGTYASVLTGITSSNLTSTTGTYGSATWLLSNTSGSIWDLIISGIYTGPSVANTNQSLVNTASVLQGTYTLQNSVLANGFSYDCNVFGANDVCVSAGGRNTTAQAANGLNNTSALLIAAYRPHPNYRIGAYADQNLSVSNPGGTVNLGNSTLRISGQRDHPFQANDRSFQSERDHLFQNQRDR